MDAIFPVITKRFYLFGLATNVFAFPVFDLPRASGYLPIRIKFDAIWRVDIDALHLAAQVLALGQARHHIEAVAEDHAVRPMLIMLVELQARFRIVEPVKIHEEVGRIIPFRCALS